MRLDDELVAPLRAVAERFALPKVRALHLPPREAVQAARRAGRGEFCLLELDDGTPGAAYVTGQCIVVDGGNSVSEER